MELKISEITVIPIKPRENGLIGFASFVLANSLYLGSIGIFTKPQGGFRLLYPTKKMGTRNINIFYPINKSFAEAVEAAVIKKLEEVHLYE